MQQLPGFRFFARTLFCGHYYMNYKHSVMDMPRSDSYNQLVYSNIFM